MSEYQKVKDFHLKFGVPTDEDADQPFIPAQDVVDYRAGFLQEELDEFRKACAEGDLEGAIDALLDLDYVLKGTALLMGVSPELWKRLFDDVQRANMAKERATSANDPRSKRGHSLDVVKPAGWVGPRGAAIIAEYVTRNSGPDPRPWGEKEKVTISGNPPVDPHAPAPNMALKSNGEHEDYWILPAHERAKGFVRPYRDKYVHDKCGGTTSMARELSETYARDPSFYGKTFCVHCRNHFLVGEFRWTADNTRVGS